MIQNALAEIDLDTLDTYSFIFNDHRIDIKMIGTVVIQNSIGDWKDFVALNINTMLNIMKKDALTTMDMGMCFPCKGIGYQISVTISKELPLIEIAPDALVDVNPVVDNKTASRRGRKNVKG